MYSLLNFLFSLSTHYCCVQSWYMVKMYLLATSTLNILGSPPPLFVVYIFIHAKTSRAKQMSSGVCHTDKNTSQLHKASSPGSPLVSLLILCIASMKQRFRGREGGNLGIYRYTKFCYATYNTVMKKNLIHFSSSAHTHTHHARTLTHSGGMHH